MAYLTKETQLDFMDIRGIIFDLDGTLGDTFPVIFPAYRQALQKFTGRIYTDEEIMAEFGPSEVGVFQHLTPQHWQECLRDYLEIYKRLSPLETKSYEGIGEMLATLSDWGLRMAVVTGKGYDSAILSLCDLGIMEYFDFVEGGSMHGVVKPACMQKVLKQWGYTPPQAAYLGDAAMDIINAKEVGVLPLGAAWGDIADVEGLKQQTPMAIFYQVGDFTQWIKTNIARKNGHPHTG